MNFRNSKPRKFRAGCHLCKPHKGMGNHSKFWRKKDRIDHEVPVPQLDVVV